MCNEVAKGIHGNISRLNSFKSKIPGNSPVKRLRSFEPNKDKLRDRVNENLVFSFELFDRNHEAFNLGNVGAEWYISLLDVLSDISSFTWGKLLNERKKIYDPHTHNWAETNYKFLFNEETLKQNEGWQFRLNKSRGRVHGFLIGNVFYVYWLDPHHNMNDSEGYPGVQKFNAGLSEYELLKMELGDLEEKVEGLGKQCVEAEEMFYKEAEKCDICKYKTRISV